MNENLSATAKGKKEGEKDEETNSTKTVNDKVAKGKKGKEEDPF